MLTLLSSMEDFPIVKSQNCLTFTTNMALDGVFSKLKSLAGNINFMQTPKPFEEQILLNTSEPSPTLYQSRPKTEFKCLVNLITKSVIKNAYIIIRRKKK